MVRAGEQLARTMRSLTLPIQPPSVPPAPFLTSVALGELFSIGTICSSAAHRLLLPRLIPIILIEQSEGCLLVVEAGSRVCHWPQLSWDYISPCYPLR
jgi:hypothetical protein